MYREMLLKQITSLIKIPTIGIGSSNFCDGQILVTDDLIGLSGFFQICKKIFRSRKINVKSIKKFRDDVRVGNFPKLNNTYYVYKCYGYI